MADIASRIRGMLWEIKGDRTIISMSEQAGIPNATLWRVMKEERDPGPKTLKALLETWPQLGSVFTDGREGNAQG